MGATVPANSTTTLVFPASSGTGIRIRGKTIKDSELAAGTTADERGNITVDVPAGTYRFELPKP